VCWKCPPTAGSPTCTWAGAPAPGALPNPPGGRRSSGLDAYALVVVISKSIAAQSDGTRAGQIGAAGRRIVARDGAQLGGNPLKIRPTATVVDGHLFART
jgi:hypothetical protein